MTHNRLSTQYQVPTHPTWLFAGMIIRRKSRCGFPTSPSLPLLEPHLRNPFQAPVPERHELQRSTVGRRVIQTDPLPAPPRLPPPPSPPPSPGSSSALDDATAGPDVGYERPNVDVLDPAAAKEAVLLPPLGSVGACADCGGGSKALELSVRVRVRADAPVKVEAARGQACLLWYNVFLFCFFNHFLREEGRRARRGREGGGCDKIEEEFRLYY